MSMRFLERHCKCKLECRRFVQCVCRNLLVFYSSTQCSASVQVSQDSFRTTVLFHEPWIPRMSPFVWSATIQDLPTLQGWMVMTGYCSNSSVVDWRGIQGQWEKIKTVTLSKCDMFCEQQIKSVFTTESCRLVWDGSTVWVTNSIHLQTPRLASSQLDCKFYIKFMCAVNHVRWWWWWGWGCLIPPPTTMLVLHQLLFRMMNPTTFCINIFRFHLCTGGGRWVKKVNHVVLLTLLSLWTLKCRIFYCRRMFMLIKQILFRDLLTWTIISAFDPKNFWSVRKTINSLHAKADWNVWKMFSQ